MYVFNYFARDFLGARSMEMASGEVSYEMFVMHINRPLLFTHTYSQALSKAQHGLCPGWMHSLGC